MDLRLFSSIDDVLNSSDRPKHSRLPSSEPQSVHLNLINVTHDVVTSTVDDIRQPPCTPSQVSESRVCSVVHFPAAKGTNKDGMRDINKISCSRTLCLLF